MMWPILLVVVAINSGFDGPDTLVICPPTFQSALEPWTQYRSNQGHRILVQSPAGTPHAIRQQVRRAARSGRLKNLLIIGDSGDCRTDPTCQVPTDFVDAKVNVHFGSEPEISSDNTYVDLDDDGVPDLTLGRITVDEPHELSDFVQRVINYESESSSGPWMRRMNFIAGVGGFGRLVDNLIEQSTRQIITDLIPPEYTTSMTYGSWLSPYCPDPRSFGETTIERFNEGCLFWTYIGHGHKQQLDSIRLPDSRHGILDIDSVDQIHARAGAPIAVFLACYTGACEGEHDCLAEQMLQRPAGPIAVISSTRVSMPYAMAVLSLEMLEGYFQGDTQTLGQLFLKSKQKLVQQPENPSVYRNMVDGMGKAFSPAPGLLDQERAEHVHLMHLYGDPLLRLKRPMPITLDVDQQVTAGQTLHITGVCSGGRKVDVGLEL